MSEVNLLVDGARHSLDVDPQMPLLYALRNDLDLPNPRFGCGLGQCGACTVLLDGRAVRACITPIGQVQGRAVTTLAGIGSPDNPHPVQQAFVDEWAAQCGYCLNGWIMTTVAFLEQNPHPSETDIREALSGIKCRCAMHLRFLQAFRKALALRHDSVAAPLSAGA